MYSLTLCIRNSFNVWPGIDPWHPQDQGKQPGQENHYSSLNTKKIIFKECMYDNQNRLCLFVKYYVIICLTRVLHCWCTAKTGLRLRCLYAQVRVYPAEYKGIFSQNRDYSIGALILKSSNTYNDIRLQRSKNDHSC